MTKSKDAHRRIAVWTLSLWGGEAVIKLGGGRLTWSDHTRGRVTDGSVLPLGELGGHQLPGYEQGAPRPPPDSPPAPDDSPDHAGQGRGPLICRRRGAAQGRGPRTRRARVGRTASPNRRMHKRSRGRREHSGVVRQPGQAPENRRKQRASGRSGCPHTRTGNSPTLVVCITPDQVTEGRSARLGRGG